MNSLLVVLGFIPGIFSYPSAEQAMLACFDWTFEGVSHYFAIDPYDLTKGGRTVFARRCKEEVKTRQWLGTESETLTNAERWDSWDPVPNDFEIKKHFRY